MLGTRAVRTFGLLLSALSATSCGDLTRSTSPPTASAVLLPVSLRVSSSFVALGRKETATAVLWASTHPRGDQTASAIIGPRGGTLLLANSDFSLTIPAGALSAPTAITITAVRGKFVVYDMQPHGLRFLKPVTAVQGLQRTATYGTDAGNTVRPAYLPDGGETIAADGSAVPVELEASTTLFSGATPVAESQEWILNHFSRYILISGVWQWVAN